MHHLISGINSHSLRQPRLDLSPPDSPYFHDHLTSSAFHYHSCHPSPHHSFIPISKLFFFSNLILHRHLAPTWTDSTAIRTCSRFLFLLFSVLLSFSFHYYSLFLTFSVFSLLFYYSLLKSFFEFCQFYI